MTVMQQAGPFRGAENGSGDEHHRRRRSGLVLDDNDASRFLIGSWLRQAGFDVREAATGAQAFEVLQQDTIDLAVLDVNLPDISGYEVCEAIRANPATTWMPVIHVSATAIQAADRSEGLLRGADAFLVHPIERSDFVGVRHRAVEAVVGPSYRDHDRYPPARHSPAPPPTSTAPAKRGPSSGRWSPARRASPRRRRRSSCGPAAAASPSPDSPPRGRSTDDVLAELLLPAQAGVTTLVTDDRGRRRPSRTSGCRSSTRPASPSGAILAPADVEQTDEILSLFAHLGIATSLALANIRALSVEHRIALVLQRSLLPERPARHPGSADRLQVRRRLAASPGGR